MCAFFMLPDPTLGMYVPLRISMLDMQQSLLLMLCLYRAASERTA